MNAYLTEGVIRGRGDLFPTGKLAFPYHKGRVDDDICWFYVTDTLRFLRLGEVGLM